MFDIDFVWIFSWLARTLASSKERTPRTAEACVRQQISRSKNPKICENGCSFCNLKRADRRTRYVDMLSIEIFFCLNQKEVSCINIELFSIVVPSDIAPNTDVDLPSSSDSKNQWMITWKRTRYMYLEISFNIIFIYRTKNFELCNIAYTYSPKHLTFFWPF